MLIPQRVLSGQLSEVLGDRIVDSAVFTTFNFDPGFFEMNILPLLFPNQKFSEAEKVRLIQLEDCLRLMNNLAVYYDANALSLDGDTPKLGYSRIDVHWKRGVFHPKVILLLVHETDHEKIQSLIVCSQSVNLTRAGWWENVECSHIEVVQDKRIDNGSCSFRNDLMSLLRRIRTSLPNERHDALDVIHHFIRYRTNPCSDEDSNQNGARMTRLFGGSGKFSFAEWLNNVAQIPKDWNLEVISPYFDQNNTKALEEVIHTTQPRRTRVYLPQNVDGTALVTEKVFNDVNEMRHVNWAYIPEEVRRRGTGIAEKLSPRFVHAKVYRFWRKQHWDLIVVGSVNCTQAAHSKPDRGNLEAGFVVNMEIQKPHREWWLKTSEDQLSGFVETNPDETDGNDRALFNVVVRYDWAVHKVVVRMDGNILLPLTFVDPSEKVLFDVDTYKGHDWQVCDQEAADLVREAIASSSFLNVHCDGVTWRILIREENFSHRPSLLLELTPDEILKYWSLLSPEQRTAFLENRMVDNIEGLKTSYSPLINTTDSVFHQFTGIFHAFGHLRRHLRDCLEQEQVVEAECRLFGAKYDSLPELLRKMIEKEDHDVLLAYVTFLTAKQLRNWIVAEFKWFLEERKAMLRNLDCLLQKGLALRKGAMSHKNDESKKFISWFEDMFLKEFQA